jgi:hypothetical protein
VVVLVTTMTGLAQVPEPRPPEAGRGVSESLTAIRAAFLANDVERLSPHFPSRQAVLIRMAPLERGARLGPGPMRAFLSCLVSGRTTVGFEIPPVDPTGSGDVRLHVKVRWSYLVPMKSSRESGSATLQVESLHLSLRYAPEDAEWLIVEMTTAGR